MSLGSLGFKFVRPLLHAMDAERAHRLTLQALKTGLGGMAGAQAFPHLAVQRFGLNFPNPLGLAAGFDKNAEVPDAMLAQGFGFVEVGTVTPKPQEGNSTPRLFRLAEDQAVINRMGFNNEGHAAVLARLQRRGASDAIIGVNLGANKNSADRRADYVAGVVAFSDVASYFTVNISSPNTPGLRDLQTVEQLQALLQELNAARRKLKRNVPMLLKIAPDLATSDLRDIAACCKAEAVDGVIISNTTTARPHLTSRFAEESGGLSGAPLFDPSTLQLARFYTLSEGKIPLVGVGGISNAEQAWAKICAGASLLQLYSALVFHGPALVSQILEGLSRKLAHHGLVSLDQAVGRDAENPAYHNPAGK